jgi:hypothetical protein
MCNGSDRECRMRVSHDACVYDNAIIISNRLQLLRGSFVPGAVAGVRLGLGSPDVRLHDLCDISALSENITLRTENY